MTSNEEKAYLTSPEIDMSPLHIHPFQSDLHPVSDLEGPVRPFPHQAVTFLVILVVIVMKAGHPNEALDIDIHKFHKETKAHHPADHPFENVADLLFHESNPVPVHNLPFGLHGHPLPLREVV